MARHASESKDELDLALYPERGLPTRHAANSYQCSCGDRLSAGMSTHDANEHLRDRHGERPYRPEPEYYVTPNEERRKEHQPDFIVVLDEICSKHGGRTYIIQYDNETKPTVIDTCDRCIREG